ncbi:hypothetical protein J8F10_11395 [Gemmata sp. G18]|uniref:Carboxypeptidase regulatory-like domain-containing protein n=1 Tax=Gemmata palustris TaxID=2822762 RepID=A0ABS5BQE5_9BACT|nr:hypothetical protein [Gemmata palustris]MBP3955890.1 hypothetical protein [Gemmata palustris]
MRFRFGRAVVLALIALAPSACEKKETRVPVYPVSGKVLVGGKPVAGVMIVLHAADGTQPAPAKPNAKTAADGTFRLSSYDPQDGAPAGTYAVTLFWFKNNPDDDGSADRFKGKYANPEKPARTVTITAGPNELPVFELTRPDGATG